MAEKLKQLKAALGEVYDLGKAAAVLEWDQQAYMPPGGAAGRAEQTATLRSLEHGKFTAAKIGRWLTELKKEYRRAAPESDEAALVRVTARAYDRATKVPAALVAEISRATTLAHEHWVEARRQKNFKLFEPHLENIFALQLKVAKCFGKQESPYDALLDGYEPGMKASQVRAVFAELRREIVPLVKAISARPESDDALLHRDYAEQKQWDFGLEVIQKLGYDLKRGRQDKVVHPFCTSFNTGDVRITTRVDKNFLPTCLMGTIHETGHALYEQGLDPRLERTPLCDSASLGIHESQSRMWENLVGRSRAFWKIWYPRLQAVFPENLGGVDLDSFYRAINKVKPSYIRVEADEVTYNLHTMLRFEIEVDVLEGRLAVKDIPATWNAKYNEYFGHEVTDDAAGCLQDVHWSMGLVGYFPTYTLGNIISVQFYDQAVKDNPSISGDLERGEYGSLLKWLRENVHRHGRKYLPTELIKRVTGSGLDSKPYIAYLKRKYSEVYGL
jgi:carboxypeptidase Taq